MENQKKPLPKLFWVVALIAVLWNLMGVGAYFSDLFVSAEMLAELEPDVQQLYLDMTLFQKIVYGMGVFGGLIGAIGLLVRKQWCIFFFMISLIGVILQFAYGLIFTNSLKVLGPTSLILPSVVILIAAFLFWYSRYTRAQGIIS